MPSSELQLPLTRLGTYELVKLLAQGGMADIYLAQEATGRHVAVKVLNPARAREAESCELFMDEARLVGMLEHDNLASVLDVASEGGVHYLAMEYVHGADLREVLSQAAARDAAIPFACALTIVAGAAAGLDYAHRRCDATGRPLHLVHRDVSLSNIMVAHDGSVKIIDFGIASSNASVHTTNPGIVRGKASYMSPEQCMGDVVDLRTDIFALGVVLYELTTGRRCFNGNSDFDRMLAVVRGDWARPSEIIPGFPAALEDVICTALALDPAHRYPSAAAMIEALEAVADYKGWQLGAAATAPMMRQLFGTVRAPWAIEADDATFVCPPPAPLVTHVPSWTGDIEPSPASAATTPGVAAPQPTKVLTRPRRLARGTESDTSDAVEHADWEDVPTRGRRSLSSSRARLLGMTCAA